jgi:hypothetical protein
VRLPAVLAAALVLAPVAAGLLAAPSAVAGPRRDAVAKAATVTTSITATPQEVYDAVRQALSEWKVRKGSLEESLLKTEWSERSSGDAVYRTRLVAEWQVDGYQVLLSVKCEKQLKQSELRPSLGGPSASWMDVSGDYELARAVVTSVERALGVDEAEYKIGQRPATPSRPIEVWDCFVSPQAASRIIDLKSKRRELVTEIKAMDEQIVAAVTGGRVSDVQADVDRLKARKAEMESQVTVVDREILQLVISD